MDKIIFGNKFVNAYAILRAVEVVASDIWNSFALALWSTPPPTTVVGSIPSVASPEAPKGRTLAAWLHTWGSFLWQIFTFWGLRHPPYVCFSSSVLWENNICNFKHLRLVKCLRIMANIHLLQTVLFTLLLLWLNCDYLLIKFVMTTQDAKSFAWMYFDSDPIALASLRPIWRGYYFKTRFCPAFKLFYWVVWPPWSVHLFPMSETLFGQQLTHTLPRIHTDATSHHKGLNF